jgi:murein endopeptidase
MAENVGKPRGGVFSTGHMSPSGVDMQNWCSLIKKEFLGE